MHIDIGALAPPLIEQLERQGLEVKAPGGKTKGELIMHWQRDLDALVRLYVRGLVTDSEKIKVARRLLKQIAKHAYKMEAQNDHHHR